MGAPIFAAKRGPQPLNPTTINTISDRRTHMPLDTANFTETTVGRPTTWEALIQAAELSTKAVEDALRADGAAAEAMRAVPRPLAPAPADLTVCSTRRIIIVVDGEQTEIPAEPYTYKRVADIMEHFRGDAEAAAPMLAALAEQEAAQAVLDRASGYAKAANAYERTSRALDRALDAQTRAYRAVFAFETADPAHLARKAVMMREGDPPRDGQLIIRATRRALEAASRATPPTETLLDVWHRARDLDQLTNSATLDEAEESRLTSEMIALENHIYAAPILCRDDAIAKLCAAGMSLVRGARTDGADEPCYEEAVAWLSSQRGAQ